jgi:hypothetical protein
MGYDLVVSYAREDREIALDLCNQLIAEGVKARIAPRMIEMDQNFAMGIVSMIVEAKVLVVVMSEFANASGQMIREIELASKNGLEILPVRLDQTKPAGSLGYYLSDKTWFSRERGQIESGEAAAKISRYLESQREAEAVAVEKVQAAMEELKQKSETGEVNLQKKTYSAILAMLAIPLVFIVMIWALVSRFDFNGDPADAEYEAARKHVIEVQDDALEDAIREALLLEGLEVEGPLTEADLWDLTTLKVISLDEKDRRVGDSLLKDTAQIESNDGLIEIDGVIESLDGLEYAKNLESLIIAGQSVQDLDPIGELTGLRFLDLGGNQISSISVLENFADLRLLCLDDNAIRDISPLASLNRLTRLNLANNEIIDITALENLKDLNNLNMANNKIHSIRSLKGLTGLEGLNVSGNLIDELGDLSDLEVLTLLNISDNQLSSVDGLSSIDSLKWLYLDGNQVGDLSFILELDALMELGIAFNPIQNLDVLEASGENFQVLWVDTATYRSNVDFMNRLEEREITIYVIDE